MGKDSHISWTDNTFNPFWGCTKISEGCKLCYAQTLAKRWGFDIWGDDKQRRFFGEKHWREPLVWEEQAAIKGIKETVFCGSMCDIFEDREDLNISRQRLWMLIQETPRLTWLLLTKRPENIYSRIPAVWSSDGFPANIWLGVTVESPKYMWRYLEITKFQTPRFISFEPLLDTSICMFETGVDYVKEDRLKWINGGINRSPASIERWGGVFRYPYPDWVIIGGESGAGCRQMEIDGASHLNEQCQALDIPVFVKQLGGFPDKQDRIEEWPKSLQVQQFPEWEQKESKP